MKKQLGILRNRHDRLIALKKEAHRKKNRFQMVGKDDFEDAKSQSLTTAHSDPASLSELELGGDQGSAQAVKLFQQARARMKQVADLQKKIAQLTKARLTSLRQKQNEKYDQKISKLANQATQAVMAAEGVMRQISKIEVVSSTSKKILKSMEASLANQIQQTSRKLRNQEQEYFRNIRAYQGTVNRGLSLTSQQRKIMEGEGQWNLLQEQDQQDTLHEGKVGELVGNITKLSAIYKDLTTLVVAQGTVIDRIDYNLVQTQQHTSKAVVHLTNANQNVNSPFADKVIRTLAVAIILFGIVLGLKWMN